MRAQVHEGAWIFPRRTTHQDPATVIPQEKYQSATVAVFGAFDLFELIASAIISSFPTEMVF